MLGMFDPLDQERRKLFVWIQPGARCVGWSQFFGGDQSRFKRDQAGRAFARMVHIRLPFLECLKQVGADPIRIASRENDQHIARLKVG